MEVIHINGTIYGYVYDYSTGDFLNGVAISYRQGSDSGSVVTDAGGYYYISNLDGGYVYLTYELAGYAKMMDDVYIDELYGYTAVRGGGEVPYYETKDMWMYELGATVSGVVLKEVGPYGQLRPAVNWPIKLYYDDYYLFPDVVNTTTNSRGEFTFTDLPGDTWVILHIDANSDEDNFYDYRSDGFYTSLTNSIDLRYTMWRDNLGIYLVSSNLWATNGTIVQDFAVDGSIQLNFNQTVSKDLTEFYGYITLSGVALDPDVDIEYSGSTVTITPPVNLLNDANYVLDFIIASETPGDTYGNSMSFHTEE
jgi:hypothetical protein